MNCLEEQSELTPELRKLILRMMQAQLDVMLAIYGSPERLRKMLEEKEKAE